MSQVIFSLLSMADIDKIWDYTAEEWGADQADSYTDNIRDACYGLVEGQRIGRNADIRDGYMKYAVGKHFIFYRFHKLGIEVIRVLHQSMDTKRHLNP